MTREHAIPEQNMQKLNNRYGKSKTPHATIINRDTTESCNFFSFIEYFLPVLIDFHGERLPLFALPRCHTHPANHQLPKNLKSHQFSAPNQPFSNDFKQTIKKLPAQSNKIDETDAKLKQNPTTESGQMKNLVASHKDWVQKTTLPPAFLLRMKRCRPDPGSETQPTNGSLTAYYKDQHREQ